MPSNTTLPALGSTSRRMLRPSVVLPQPLSPIRPSVSPRAICRLTWFTACTLAGRRPNRRASTPASTGKCLTRPSTRSSGSVMPARSAPARPAATVRIAIGVRHASCASRQRGRKRHPVGSSVGIGHLAFDRQQHLFRLVKTWPRGQQRARVGMRRRVDHLIGGTGFDDLAGIHHRHPIAVLRHHAEVVGDQHDAHAELLRASRRSVPAPAPGSSRRARWSVRRRSAASDGSTTRSRS